MGDLPAAEDLPAAGSPRKEVVVVETVRLTSLVRCAG
jgi:hypothetical protein